MKLLYQYGQMNTSAITCRLGVNYGITLQHLELLESEGIVQHTNSGRTRFFRFTKTVKARATMKLLEEWAKE